MLMGMREKLIEMLRTGCDNGNRCDKSCFECLADYLVRNGVTIPVR